MVESIPEKIKVKMKDRGIHGTGRDQHTPQTQELIGKENIFKIYETQVLQWL